VVRGSEVRGSEFFSEFPHPLLAPHLSLLLPLPKYCVSCFVFVFYQWPNCIYAARWTEQRIELLLAVTF
jgi:hypothetical protein